MAARLHPEAARQGRWPGMHAPRQGVLDATGGSSEKRSRSGTAARSVAFTRAETFGGIGAIAMRWWRRLCPATEVRSIKFLLYV
jgi:hypothetical protein